MRLLVVEDEPRMAQILHAALRSAAFAVDSVGTCEDAREAFSVVPYDAAVLDLGLPDGDGILLLKELRGAGNRVPILVLTARDAVEARVSGLDAGADDYLVKPFAMAEVIARVKALLRRPGGALGTTLAAGNIAFDTIGRDVRVADRVLQLPRRESTILEHLMRRLGRVVPKSVPALLFDRVEPEFGAVVMQRRTERRDHRYRGVVRARRAPPSAHLHVSGRAPAVNPQGVDRRRHAAAGAKPCVRMGLPSPPP
jgi:DNA-binding response OmpR family regulator